MKEIPFPKIIEDNNFKLQAAIDIVFADSFAKIVKNNISEFKFLPHTSQIFTQKKAINEIKNFAKMWLAESMFSYFIINNENLIGFAGIKIKNPEHTAEICYWLDKKYTGKGHATTAVLLLEKIIFAANYQRIEIWCNADNLPSIKIPLRLNYHLDGTLRYAEYILEKYHDVLIFSKLKGE